MTNSHNSTFLPTPGSKSLVLCTEVSIFCTACSPDSLTQCSSEPAIAVRRLSAFPFPGAFIIPRTYPGPRGQMPPRRKLFPIIVNRCYQIFCRNVVQPRGVTPSLIIQSDILSKSFVIAEYVSASPCGTCRLPRSFPGKLPLFPYGHPIHETSVYNIHSLPLSGAYNIGQQ